MRRAMGKWSFRGKKQKLGIEKKLGEIRKNKKK